LRNSLGFVKDILEITMPNRALTACLAFSSGFVLTGYLELPVLILGIMTIICTYCPMAIYNNILDIKGDKINAPDRPLPSGRISIKFAKTLMIGMIVLSFIMAYFVSTFFFLAILLWVIMGYIYSKHTKSVWFLSYFTLVTTHIIIPIISGYLIFGVFDTKLLMIVIFMYVTEVIAFSLKDYKDIDGDRKMSMNTLPIHFNKKVAVKITAAGLIFPLFLSWFPWHFFELSIYFIIIYILAGLVRSHFARKLITDSSPASAISILKNFRYVLLLEMFAWCLS